MEYKNSPEIPVHSFARSFLELAILCVGLTASVMLSRWGQQHQKDLAIFWLPNLFLIGLSIIWIRLGFSPTVRTTDGLSSKTIKGIVIFLCVMIVTFASYWPSLEIEQYKIYAGGISIVVLIALVPFAEEMFFRGILLDHLRRNIGPLGATVAVSLLFGILHAGQGSIVSMILLSLVACAAVLATGNVIWAVCIHITWNACAIMHLQTPPTRILPAFVAVGTLAMILIFILKARDDKIKAISQCPEA